MITKSLTINGFTFNNYTAANGTRWANWIQLEKVDGLDSPEIERETVALAYQHGVLESERFFRQRLITITANILAPSRVQRNTLEKQLKAVLSPIYNVGVTGSLIYRDEDENFDRIVYCKPTGDYKAPDELGEFGKRKVQFSLIAEDPRIYKNTITTKTISLNKNLLLWTEDISQAVWINFATATKTGTDTLNMPAGGDGMRQDVTTGNHAGKTYTFQVELKGTPGQTIQLYIANGVGGSGGTPATITLTDSYALYSVTRVFSGAETSTVTPVYIRRSGGATATSVQIRRAQLTEGSTVELYHKNDGTYGSTNGITLGTLVPIYLSTGVGDAKVITNAGTFNTYPTVTLYGPVLNPAIVNETTERFLQLFYKLEAGEYLQFDMKNRRITKNDGSQIYGYLTDGSDFWDLAPGDNTIGFAAEDYEAATYVELSFRDAFV